MPSFQTADVLIGRAVELDEVRRALRAATSDPSPMVVRILGGSGIGKSTFLRTVLTDAQRVGWLPVAVTCRPAHRLRPLTVLGGIIRSLLRSLGDDAARYTSGLEAMLATLAPSLRALHERRAEPPSLTLAHVEAGFLRLVQGVLNDYPVIVALDDVVHADLETVRMVDYVLAAVSGSACVVLAAGEMDHEASFSPSLPTISLTLRPLPDDLAARVVEAAYPGACDDVTRAIVGHARGIPLDIVTLAANAASEHVHSAEGVLDGVRAVVRSELQNVGPAFRHVLQLCAVVSGAVPLRLLVGASGISENELVDMVTRDSERYLVRRGTTVLFRHQLIADAVRSTVANELILKRRALEIELAVSEPLIDDLERIVALAEDCGERHVQHEHLMRLADAAYRALRFESAVGYYRRALAVRAPRPDEYLDFYTKFTTSLRANDYDEEAARVLTEALHQGEEQRVQYGLGAAVAALVLTLCTLDDLDRARRLGAYYAARLERPEDRSEVLASAACMYADTMQIAQLEETLAQAAALPRATNYAQAKLAYARAIADARLGDHEAASRALNSAAFYAELDRSLLAYNIRFDQLFIDFRHYGNAALKDHLPALARDVSAETGTHAFATYLACFSDFLDGEWERATDRLAQINRMRFTPAVRARLLSVPAAIQAFSLRASAYAQEVQADVDVLVRGLHERSAVQLGTWWIAYAASTDRAAAEPVALKLRTWSAKPPAFSAISFMPVSLALHAERTHDRETLRELAEYAVAFDTSPWMEANVILVRGVAQHALGDRAGTAKLREAAQRFERLAAPFPAAYAAMRAGTATARDRRLLGELHVERANAPSGARRPAGGPPSPTVRELEIARLVARGNSNRKIAEELFLSERTVEVHIANLFAKLNVTSRTHLTGWIYEHGEAR